MPTEVPTDKAMPDLARKDLASADLATDQLMQAASREPLKPCPFVKERDTQDGTVLLHPKTGMMFPLDEVGAFIWKKIKEGLDAESISQQLAVICAVPKEQVTVDVNAFVNQMIDAKLLVSPRSASPPRNWLRQLLWRLLRRNRDVQFCA